MKKESKRMQSLKKLGLIGCLNDSDITSETKIGPLPQWIKCSDCLPKELRQVLVYSYLKPMQICHLEECPLPKGLTWFDSYDYPLDEKYDPEITHWMPLPEAPHD